MNENEQETQRLLEELGTALPRPSFEAGFADRVMARVEASTVVDLTTERARAMGRLFLRLAPAALAASIVLAAYSLNQEADVSGRTTFEVVLGLPQVSVEAAYAAELLPLGG